MKRERRRFPVTVQQLPTVTCQLCSNAIVVLPGRTGSQTLTEHYLKRHEEAPR